MGSNNFQHKFSTRFDSSSPVRLLKDLLLLEDRLCRQTVTSFVVDRCTIKNEK
jgi:hypothetical protein